jgi:hypothetical protein
LKLVSFNYTIDHIPGYLNVWADFLTRWAAPTVNSEAFDFHKFEDIVESQNKYFSVDQSEISFGSQTFVRDRDNVFVSDNILLIADKDRSLILRVCIVAHCGSAGHRAVDVT